MLLLLRGIRRRTVALASLTALAVYLTIYALALWAPFTNADRFLNQPVLLQLAILAPAWLGAFLVALAQRDMIAHGEGIYAALLAITQVRGMRLIGLGFGAVMVLLLALAFLTGGLSARFGIVAVLSALTLIPLGLPDAPDQAYRPAGNAIVVSATPSVPRPRTIVRQEPDR